jgi:hypothetical protein
MDSFPMVPWVEWGRALWFGRSQYDKHIEQTNSLPSINRYTLETTSGYYLKYEVIEILHPTNSQEFYLGLFRNAQLKSYLEHKMECVFPHHSIASLERWTPDGHPNIKENTVAQPN